MTLRQSSVVGLGTSMTELFQFYQQVKKLATFTHVITQ